MNETMALDRVGWKRLSFVALGASLTSYGVVRSESCKKKNE